MRTALLLFGFGLALRTLFWLATGDRFDLYAAAFQGDAPVWAELVNAAATGRHELFEVPLRPPAMYWLVSLLWDGSPDTMWVMRLAFVLLGALIAPLVYLLVRPHTAATTALAAGVLCGAASNLMTLGSGPHSELPYLVLVLLTLFDQERLRLGASRQVAMRWGLLHGLLCLVRAEHALTFAMFTGLVAMQSPTGRRTALVAITAFALALLPWHAAVAVKLAYKNDSDRQMLWGTVTPAWEPEALRRLAGLPAFQQVPVHQFVTDTMRVRGADRVTAKDLDVVREAYGTWPEPLSLPFVCLYGGLNFFLANSPEAAGGFSGAALDRPPPLTGGDARYPRGLRQVLPRQGKLVLSYPPHLDRINHGYAAGFDDILTAPAAAAGRIATKLWHFAQGAASGVGGHALPHGLSGTRRSVDLVTADGYWAVAMRILILAAAIGGLWTCRRRAWLWPWLLLLASKLTVTAVFFGYARQGALCVPVIMIGLALASTAVLRARVITALALVLLGIELVRAFTTEVVIELPGGGATTLAPNDFQPVAVHYRWR